MICPDCKNSFLQPFVCTTCGAEKLYDTTLANTQSELAAAQAKIARLTKRKDECSNGWDEAMAQRDKALAFLQCYRHETPLGHQPYMLAHEVDLLLKECGK